MRRESILVLAIVLLVSIPSDTRAGTYQSLTGFQINYPDGWLLATESDQKSVEEASRQFGTQMDFSSLDVMVYDPRSNPIENVNVAVLPEAMKADQDSLSTAQASIRQQLAAVGATTNDLEGQLMRFGNYDAVSATWTARYGSKDLHQWYVLIPVGAQAFVFTCSAGTSNFANAQPFFSQILNSFSMTDVAGAPLSAPQPPAESSSGMSPLLRNIVIFGILGLLLVVVSVKFIRAKPSPASPASKTKTRRR
ncbi:MAG TPA: hypothetical protein VI756_14535 [Blastocatellia bacterium]